MVLQGWDRPGGVRKGLAGAVRCARRGMLWQGRGWQGRRGLLGFVVERPGMDGMAGSVSFVLDCSGRVS